jgi:hypothetical protein
LWTLLFEHREEDDPPIIDFEKVRQKARAILIVLWLDLLLLLDRGPVFAAALKRAYRLISIQFICQPSPSLRHVGQADPRVAVAKRARHLQAHLCTTPILV